MDKYVIYRRVSTKKQGDSGLGLEAQDRDISIFFENYSGHHSVIGEYQEVESGTTSSRPELKLAIEHCKREKATLLVAKLDRLSRKVSFIATLIEEIDIKVACMPHADRFQLHIYAALAEQEREFISQRTKAALKEAKKRGVSLGGLRDITNQRNKQRAALADELAEKYRPVLLPMMKNKMSLREMASAISEATGESFYPMKIKRMLDRLKI